MQPEELKSFMEDFFVCVRKADGAENEPGTVRGMLANFKRPLQEKKYSENIMKTTKFTGMREMISSKYKVCMSTCIFY